MSFEISSNLTIDALKRIYEKLFDPLTTYNKAFFSDENTLLPLYLYNGSKYIKSVSQSYIINRNTITIKYKFENVTEYKFTAMRIYNGSELMMETTDFSIPSPNLSIENETFVELEFSLREITQCIPTASLLSMTKSLMNENNRKIDKLFIGSGDPDLSRNTYHLTDKVASYNFTNIIGIYEYLNTQDNTKYKSDSSIYGITPVITDFVNVQLVRDGRSIKITVKAKDSSMMNEITELGVGYEYNTMTDSLDTRDDTPTDSANPLVSDVMSGDSYMLCTLQQVSFSKINQEDSYIIELIINIW